MQHERQKAEFVHSVFLWHRRPGASVQISAQAFRALDVGAGQQLVFKTKRVKMGQNLAFVDTSIEDSLGFQLALARLACVESVRQCADK